MLAVADGEHRGAHPAPLATAEQVGPRLRALAVPVIEGDQLLGHVGADADHHQQAHLVLREPDLEVGAVDPHIHVVGAGQVALPEHGRLALPVLGQPGDRGRRQPMPGAEELLQRRPENSANLLAKSFYLKVGTLIQNTRKSGQVPCQPYTVFA